MRMSFGKIVWISRHNLTERNHEILDRAFGEGIPIYQIKETVNKEDIRKLTDLLKEEGELETTAFVVVLPMDLISELLKYTKNVFRFTVIRKVREDGSVEITPTGLEQILKVEVKTKHLVTI